MHKAQAKEFIKEVLTSKFDKEKFTNFVRNILNDFETKDNSYSGNLIPEAFRDHISHYRRIGRYEDPEGDLMDILIVQTKSVSKLERTRSALRNFVVRHLKTFDKNYALVAFYSKEDDGLDWRLSLVKIDYEINKSEDGRIKVQEDIVPAKRFSFLVGKHENSYTAQKQLLPLLVNDNVSPSIVKIEDEDGSIEAAFGIQKVTDEFYEQYKNLFLKLTEDKNLTDTLHQQGLEPVRFVKKLLGQIVFLYFLQKKGWLGVPRNQKMGEGSKRFIQNRFDSLPEKSNYFNEFLRHLFYDALAREHHDQGVKYYIEKLDCKIPFLNGGLFEAEYDWKNVNLNIPNELFRNDERKGDDKGTGILDVFDRYNFTIKEDEPLEKEVAVDPEMLGKVFENMLEVTERKSKGAFYTPREIVHYMCQESLIHFLDSSINEEAASYQDSEESQYGNKIKTQKKELAIAEDRLVEVPKEDLEQFIRHGHLILENDTTVSAKGRETRDYKYQLAESIRNNANDLDKALANVKVCDPAIGSGAFPVGILHEIVTARKVLVPYLSSNYVLKLQKDSGFKDTDNFPSDYYFKRHAIQESIYGADIDASAIDIARLRLWLSMIVDEEDYETIEALPNLDYKIVCGNSIIGLPQNAMRDLDVEHELENLKAEFFKETDDGRKKNLRNEINYKLKELLDSAEEFAGYKIDFDFNLFFSEVWREKGGFDIVIGNPPYVNIEKIDKKIKKISKSFRTAYLKYDLYVLFFEKAINSLKKEGVLSFITSNKFLSQGYGLKLRQEFLKHSLTEIINFNYDIFDAATVRTSILQLVKKKPSPYHLIKIIDVHTKNDRIKFENLIYNTINQSIFSSTESFNFRINLTDYKIKLLEKIKKDTVEIQDIFSVNYGLRPIPTIPNVNKTVFIKKEYKPGYKKYFEGKDMGTWGIKKSIFLDYKPDIMYNPMFENLFENPKLTGLCTLSDIGKLRFVFDDQSHYTNHSVAILTLWHLFKDETNGTIQRNISQTKIENSKKYSYQFIQGILNSSIIKFYFNELLYDGTHFYPNHMKVLPIKLAEKKVQDLVSTICSYNFELEFSKIETEYAFFCQLLEGLVFELYLLYDTKPAGKKILNGLGDVKPLKENMSQEEKLAIIRSEYKRLSHPDHLVKQNLDSLLDIAEVKFIREAIQ